MGTASDMIRRAFVLATVIGDDETPTAQQATDALADMNDMLSAWSIRGRRDHSRLFSSKLIYMAYRIFYSPVPIRMKKTSLGG